MTARLISTFQNTPLEADRRILMTDGCGFVYSECKLVCVSVEGTTEEEIK